MTKTTAALVTLLLASLPGTAMAHGHNQPDNPGPYSGFQTREIKSLSNDDIAEIRRGGGWGLALPAELSGRPGPAHLLELRNEIGLSADQVAKVEKLFGKMREEAIEAGERFITAEAALSRAFEDPGLDREHLGELLDDAATARAELRFVHLSRHLATTDILSAAQIQTYNFLRGYAEDPCARTPDGHDPELWRQHNGCG